MFVWDQQVNYRRGIGVLLNSDNYKCGMSIRTEETVNELDRGGIRTIFHNPYKSKVARVFEHPDEQGIISMVQYGVEKGGNYEIKYIYTYENGGILKNGDMKI